MTAQLTLAVRDDFVGDIGTLSLLGYTNGIELAADGWVPGQLQAGQDRITEAMTLRVRGTSTDNLAANVQGLANMVRLVKQAKQPSERYGVWLRAELPGESKSYQAYITDARHVPLVAPFSPEVNNSYQLNEYSFGFERMPYWEAGTAKQNQCGTINSVGGMQAVGGVGSITVYGDQAARISSAYLSTKDDTTLTKFWYGFRSPQYGSPANFQPYWCLELGYAFGADTTGGHTNADATAKDGYKTITTFATVATLAVRTYILPGNVSGNPNDQRGTFKVLLRAKNSAAGTVRVRLGDRIIYSAAVRYQSRVAIASTSWQFYDLGQVTIPSPGNLVYGGEIASNYCLSIDAERVSGACNLEMDCLVLIPNDECSVYVPDANVQTSGGTALYKTYVIGRPDGNIKSYVAGAMDIVAGLSTPYSMGAGLPIGTLVMAVGAAQRAGSSVLTDNFQMVLDFIERWDYLRGNE